LLGFTTKKGDEIMKKEYDDTIAKHYETVAKEHGTSSTSTMADETTRALETEAISQFVGESIRLRQAEGLTEPATIMDVGCGNGYTLETLSNQYPDHNYVGIEQSDELRALAQSRFKSTDRVRILKGDIRDGDFSRGTTADILICQRVLINLLAIADQKEALSNIVASVKSPSTWGSGGTLLFIESFESSLARLNEARSEFDLPVIPPAHHNLYLPDDFFKVKHLKPFRTDGVLMPPNFLSTHYYVTRVLHAIFTPKDKPFKRNSEFVKFFTDALNQNAGDYSPLKLYLFEKTEEA